jgi:hypothetical protein
MSQRRGDDTTYTLLSNGSATGNSTNIRGGYYAFTTEGTIGGATVGLQMQTPNGTWSTVQVWNASPVQTTAVPYLQTGIDLPAGAVRAVVTGGTPSALYCYLVGLG